MKKEIKEKIIEILKKHCLKFRKEGDAWIPLEQPADQILSLFEAEKEETFEKVVKALDLEVKDMPAFPPKETDLITLAVKIGMAKKMAEKIGEIEKEKKQQSTKPSIDELGRPNLTPTEIIERAEIRGFNQALETAIKILKK